MTAPLAVAARLGIGLAAAGVAAAAWTLYRDPALGLMLDAFRFCG